MLSALHPLNWMAVWRVTLTESWVCSRAGLQPAAAETVKTISLQGTLREKILSLGDAFKNFKSLRSLDLSRNIIVSLQGIEYLHTLRFLNLYYNEIASLGEIEHLRHLPRLKGLDLRLNPITKLNPEYRLFVIHMVGALQVLDDRPVMDGERKGANSYFRMKEHKTQKKPNREIGSATLGHVFGEKTTPPRDHLDYSSTIVGKMSDWKYGSPSKYLMEELQPHVQPPNDFEDGIEYRPLPSPTRSSLRSPGPTSRPKEAQRVTFSDSTLTEFTPKREDLAKRLESEDLTSTRKPISNNPDTTGTAFSFKNTYLTSTPVKKDVTERMKADARACNVDGQSTDLRERLRFPNSAEESSRERLLRLSSDLYATTHLNNTPTSSNSLAGLRKGFSDVSSTYTLPSKPTLANTTLSKPFSRSELSRDYKGGWSQDTESGISSNSGCTPQPGIKRASSLNSLLHPRPSSTYQDCHNDLWSENELKKSDSLSDEVPAISSALQQLTDLVDRYWNGSGSLLQNQRFLVPARDLLSHLLTSNTAQKTSPVEQQRATRISPGQVEHDNNMESLKLKMIKIMEENHFLRVKVCKLENQTPRKEGSGPNTPAHGTDHLQQKYEHLKLQVESLQENLKQTSTLQETVNLLQDSQRSLVCTNEYLLQQLKHNSPTDTTKAQAEPSPHRISTNRYLFREDSEPSHLPAAHSPHNSWTMERLSVCPL
ncbi:leucine-rich repeat-containing protein 36-like isoform X2 [Pseudophryne corroboree]|uniref:leucine-rich repeat-containing protein 36-like isoform X2 n=1 Tax=Pseudophryne corroboree TaxID=495146 RepID=UPI0030820980